MIACASIYGRSRLACYSKLDISQLADVPAIVPELQIHTRHILELNLLQAGMNPMLHKNLHTIERQEITAVPIARIGTPRRRCEHPHRYNGALVIGLFPRDRLQQNWPDSNLSLHLA